MDEAPEKSGPEYWAIEVISRRLSGMDIFEAVGLVLLVAMSVRFVATIVGAAITVGQNGLFQNVKQRIAGFLTYAGSFSEISGVLLVLGTLAFLWWRVGRWVDIIDEEEDEPEPDASLQDALSHIRTLSWLCRWTRLLLVISLVGATMLVVPNFLELPRSGLQWGQVIVTTAFQIADVAILVGGIVLSNRLCETCDLSIRESSDEINESLGI
jgi:hypothetical protein